MIQTTLPRYGASHASVMPIGVSFVAAAHLAAITAIAPPGSSLYAVCVLCTTSTLCAMIPILFLDARKIDTHSALKFYILYAASTILTILSSFNASNPYNGYVMESSHHISSACLTILSSIAVISTFYIHKKIVFLVLITHYISLLSATYYINGFSLLGNPLRHVV